MELGGPRKKTEVMGLLKHGWWQTVKFLGEYAEYGRKKGGGEGTLPEESASTGGRAREGKN